MSFHFLWAGLCGENNFRRWCVLCILVDAQRTRIMYDNNNTNANTKSVWNYYIHVNSSIKAMVEWHFDPVQFIIACRFCNLENVAFRLEC